MAQVAWTHRALADVNAIQAHIEQFRPEHPERGRLAGRLRELATVPPYLIRYRVRAGAVEIIRIKHGAQRSE